MAKKQNITVTGRAANERIEQAIPDFMQRLGMAEDQATATAIRLESVGRLQSGGLITARLVQMGPQRLILAAIAANRLRRKPVTIDRSQESDDIDQLRTQTRRRNRSRRK